MFAVIIDCCVVVLLLGYLLKGREGLIISSAVSLIIFFLSIFVGIIAEVF